MHILTKYSMAGFSRLLSQELFRLTNQRHNAKLRCRHCSCRGGDGRSLACLVALSCRCAEARSTRALVALAAVSTLSSLPATRRPARESISLLLACTPVHNVKCGVFLAFCEELFVQAADRIDMQAVRKVWEFQKNDFSLLQMQ